MAATQQAERLHCFMHDSDPVSPNSYWPPVSLIPPVQPIGVIASISDERMKGQKEGRGSSRYKEIEVKADKNG